MFNREELRLAVDLHRRSYSLLRWLSTAISKGVIRFDRAHDYMDEAEVAKEWIHGHYMNLPPSCRPTLDHLGQFAQFFATYLTTSFDLVEKPGERLISECGCMCPMCSYFTSAPHLKVKKVSPRDKKRARKIKTTSLQQLAREQSVRLEDREVEKLIDSQESARDVSLLAYGQQLVERSRGRSEGPAVLALWREIAWEPTGSPKKNFELEVDDILNAEQALVKKISL